MKKNNTDIKIEDIWVELIIDDLTHNISPSDKNVLDEWLNSSDKNKEYYSELKEIWITNTVLEESKKYNHKSAFQLFKRKTIKGNKYKIKTFLKYAAIIMSLLAGSYYISQNLPHSSAKNEFTLNSISVPKGSTSKIEFKDGSKIWMNSETELELVEVRRNERRVKLEGEIYLQVERNEASPFTVETSNAKVKVLGTIFNVNAYADNKELKVTLESGSVEVTTDLGKNIKLIPSQQLIYNLESKTFIIEQVDLKKELAWKMNNLIFSGETFREIAELLERKFKVKIEIKNKKLLNTRFSGDFINNESIEHILTVMSSKNRFIYKKEGNTIQIY